MSATGWLVLRAFGAVLLVVTGAIHLDLYETGYRTIPTIGNLFLLQIVSAFVLAVIVLVPALRTPAAAGAGFLLSTLAGYLVSLRTPLFGFREVRTTAGIVAGVVEVLGFAVLAVIALRAPSTASRSAGGRVRAMTPPLAPARAAAGTLAVIAALALGLSLNAAGPKPTHSGSATATLEVRTISAVAVLTSADGFTLYWFGRDSPTSSACNGTCKAYWPPLLGTPSAGAGVHGLLGSIRRSDGTLQATYDGHPLYSYIGDGAPGDASGNGITLNGGIWHETTASAS